MFVIVNTVEKILELINGQVAYDFPEPFIFFCLSFSFFETLLIREITIVYFHTKVKSHRFIKLKCHCRIEIFINLKILIVTESKHIKISKITFIPDISSCHEKHCWEKQSNFGILDLTAFQIWPVPGWKNQNTWKWS